MCGRLPEQVNTWHAGCLKTKKIKIQWSHKISTTEQISQSDAHNNNNNAAVTAIKSIT